MPRFSCPRGTIRRKAYRRRTYRRKDGKVVKGATVPAACIKDQGAPGKGPKLFSLKSGELSVIGYSLKENAEKRHAAIDSAVEKQGRLMVLRKINALGTLFKRTKEQQSKRARTDVAYIQKKQF